MVPNVAPRLEAFLTDRVEDKLRSIVAYEPQRYEIVHLREDVANQYTESEIATAVDDARLESIGAPAYSSLYSDDHGELTCNVKCYENVIEMNFILDDGVGTAVALETHAFAETTGLVGRARDIVVEERANAFEDQKT